MTKYSKLFEPCVMPNGAILKNRIIFSNGFQTFATGPVNGPDEALITDVGIFSRSGASMVTWGHFGSMGGGAKPRPVMNVDKKALRESGHRVVPYSLAPGFNSTASFDYTDDRTWNLLGQTAETAHLYDTLVVVKLGAAFPPGKCLNGIEEKQERKIWPLPEDDIRLAWPQFEPQDPQYKEFNKKFEDTSPAPTMEELKAQIATKEELAESIEDVVDMCMRYKNIGFDGMNIRGDRWGLNACTNIREDEYGGEIEGRGRFLYEMFKKIKEVCGDDFIVEVVMPGAAPHGHDGQLPAGYTEEEFVRFIMMCEPYIDIVEVREEFGTGYQCDGYNSQLHVHPSLGYAKSLRDAGFRKIIAVNGGYNDPDEMESILEEGVVDVISTARTFRAEPDFLEKLRTEGREVPTPCIRCNKCHGSWGGTCNCAVNPKDMMNHRLPLIIKEPAKSKKVAVIGGGVIGMRAACFAAERGHRVTIFEKDSILGGKMAYYGPKYKDLWPLDRYKEWLIGELARREVTDIRLGTEPLPEDITREGFEAVIACTGSREMTPQVEGADLPGIWKDEDIYYGNVQPADNCIIVGGGEVPTETAMYIASLGKNVTIITRNDILAKKRFYAHSPHQANILYYPDLGYGTGAAAWTKYESLHPVYNAVTTGVTPGSVTYIKDGKEITLNADMVIVSGGFRPCRDEALRYASCTPEFYMAGDNRQDSYNLILGNRGAYGRALML